MKKAFLSPLCSALIIPGLGQVINHHLKKGGAILGAVFVLFIAAVVRLYQIISAIVSKADTLPPDPFTIMEKVKAEDLYLLQLITVVFGLLWLYSVVDAFLAGRKLDRIEKSNRP